MPSIAAQHSLILDLEDAMQSRDAEQRAVVLERVTTLFLSGTSDPESLALFDDVFMQLIRVVEVNARAKLSERLARVELAPPNVIESLASEDAIEVARPILAYSSQISEGSLIQIAQVKSQAHLLSIAGRSRVTPPLSDVLISRGNDGVLRRVAGNEGVQFSESGVTTLAHRAAIDEELAMNLANRSDVPPRIFRLLLTRANDRVRNSLLQNASPAQVQIICQALDEVCREIDQTLVPVISAEARRRVCEAFEKGNLNEGTLAEFARAGMFAETAASLAVLTSTPIVIVEEQMASGRTSGLLILCKSKKYKWRTAKMVICVGQDRSPSDLEQARHEYYTLSVNTAARAMRFVSARQILNHKVESALPQSTGQIRADKASAPV